MVYSPLTRPGEKIISLVKEITREQPLASMDDVYPFLDAMQRMFPHWVFIICPIHHPQSRYFSNNCEQVLGSTKEYFYDLFPVGILTDAHEDDVPEMKECFSYLQDFLKDTSSEEYLKLRLALQYRFRHKSGKYLVLQDEKATFQLQDSSVVYYSIIKDITDENPFRGVQLDIFRQDINQEKVATFRPAARNKKLSKRETELVALIRNGLRTKEIAQHLNISHHTVRNIRQRMFEKYSVNSSIELLNKAM